MSTSSLPEQPAASPEPEVYEPVAERVPRSAGLQHVLAASKAYASADTAIATRQVVVTLALLVVCLAAGRFLAFTWWHAPLVLVLAGLWVRTFVLQHDCGHLSLFKTRRANDAWGTLLSFVTSVPFHAWRTEHNWHHAHTGKLSRRGLDSNTSPPTVDEARANPKSSRKRAALVSPQFIFAMGPLGFMFIRKHPRGYVFYKDAFRWPVPDEKALTRSVIQTNIGHAVTMLAVLALMGWAAFLTIVPLAMAVACGFGSLLFWAQHNFEDTYYAPDETWDFVRAGVEGSSYLKLGPIAAWFTAHIGLHHVHHVNVRIPNYRLDEARRGVPELAAVAPLDARAFLRCFECHFWDGEKQKLVTLDDLGPLEEAPATEPATPAA